MKLNKDKYIILEIIPTNLKERDGIIIQLSALKIDSLNLLGRFDYRLKEEVLPIIEMKSWIEYDKNSFTYVDSEKEILAHFKEFAEELPILILDNIYTPAFIKELGNKQEQILDYLNLQYCETIIDDIITKYKLEPSEHIVDLLYEALMMEN